MRSGAVLARALFGRVAELVFAAAVLLSLDARWIYLRLIGTDGVVQLHLDLKNLLLEFFVGFLKIRGAGAGVGTLTSLAALEILALDWRAFAEFKLKLLLALCILGAILGALLKFIELVSLFVQLVFKLIKSLLVFYLEFLSSNASLQLIAEDFGIVLVLLDVFFDLLQSLFQSIIDLPLELQMTLQHAVFIFAIVIVLIVAHWVTVALERPLLCALTFSVVHVLTFTVVLFTSV